MRIVTLILTLFLSHFCVSQTLSSDYIEKFITSSCAMVTPLLPTDLLSRSLETSGPGPYAPSVNLAEYLRIHAEDYYEQLTQTAATYGFETLEQWATIADRVTIVSLSLTSPPGAYDVTLPSDGVVILPESQRVAGQIYLAIAALMTTVTDAEKALLRPFLDDLDRIDCFKRN